MRTSKRSPQGQHLAAEGVPPPQDPVQLLGSHALAVRAPDLDRELVAAARVAGVGDRGARFTQHLRRALDHLCRLGGRRRQAVPRRCRDPERADLDRRRVAERHRGRAAVDAVGPGQHAQQHRHVRDRARQRTDLRPRVAQRADLPEVVDHAGDRDEPGRRLRRADRHLHTRRREVVLGGERNAVQRAALFAALEPPASGSWACASARSPSTCATALTSPSTASMRRRYAVTTSTAEASRPRTRAASSRAGRPMRSRGLSP